MPDATSPTPASQTQLGSGWYDPPGGDLDLDSLFPNPEMTTQTVAPVPAATPPQALAATPSQEWFLETPSGTKYRTREDAIKGISEKDRVISEARQKAQPAPEAARNPQDNSYSSNPDRLFDDLVASANKGDKRAYAAALRQYQDEQMQATLAPYAPLLAEVQRERAIRQAEEQTHGVRAFMASPEFSEYLDQRPTLKQAIEIALSNPQTGNQGQELLQIAYEASQGRRMPDLVRNVAAQTAAAVTVQNPRPTLSTSTPTPTPAPQTAAPNLNTSDGRKAIIDAAKQRGLDSVTWDSAGL